MNRKIEIAVFLATFIFGIWSCNSSQKEKQKNARPETVMEYEPGTGKKEGHTISSETAENGKKLFNDNGCMVCHQLNTKMVGPSLKDISVAYTGNKEGLTGFLRGAGEPIVDPSQEALMQPQIPITKAMSDEELNAVVDYILSVD